VEREWGWLKFRTSGWNALGTEGRDTATTAMTLMGSAQKAPRRSKWAEARRWAEKMLKNEGEVREEERGMAKTLPNALPGRSRRVKCGPRLCGQTRRGLLILTRRLTRKFLQSVGFLSDQTAVRAGPSLPRCLNVGDRRRTRGLRLIGGLVTSSLLATVFPRTTCSALMFLCPFQAAWPGHPASSMTPTRNTRRISLQRGAWTTGASCRVWSRHWPGTVARLAHVWEIDDGHAHLEARMAAFATLETGIARSG
jgi:hypothetical protein